jgi:hypothetical protein
MDREALRATAPKDDEMPDVCQYRNCTRNKEITSMRWCGVKDHMKNYCLDIAPVHAREQTWTRASGHQVKRSLTNINTETVPTPLTSSLVHLMNTISTVVLDTINVREKVQT